MRDHIGRRVALLSDRTIVEIPNLVGLWRRGQPEAAPPPCYRYRSGRTSGARAYPHPDPITKLGSKVEGPCGCQPLLTNNAISRSTRR